MLLSSLLLKLKLQKFGISSALFCLLLSCITAPLTSQAGQWDILPEADYQQPFIQDEQTGQTILLSPNRTREVAKNPAQTIDETVALKQTLVKLHTEYEQVVRMNYQLKEVLEKQAAQPKAGEATSSLPKINPAITAEKMATLVKQLNNLKQENQQLQAQVTQHNATGSHWQTMANNQQQMMQTLQQKVDGLLQENQRLVQQMATEQPAYAAVATLTNPSITAETKQLRETIAGLKVENEALHQQVNSGLSIGEPAQAHSKLQEATIQLKQAFTTIQDQNNRITGLKEKIDSLQSLQLSNNGENTVIGLSAIESNNEGKELLQSTSDLQLLQTQLKDYEQTIQQLKTQLQKQASVVMIPIGEKIISASSASINAAKVGMISSQAKAQTAFEQGLKQEQIQNWQKALILYQQANQLQPEQPYYQLALARAFLQQEQTPASLLLLEKLRTQPSIEQEVFGLLGKAYLNQQEKGKAESAYQASFKPEALSNYAMLLKQQGGTENLKTAEALLKVAIHLHPADANLQYNLGNLYVNTQQPALAIVAYKQAITLNNKMSKAYYNLGLLEAEQANNTLAKQYFETYLQLEPNATNKESVQQALSSM